MMYFVWIETSVGAQAQIWHESPHTGEGKKKPHLYLKKLTLQEEQLTLDQLKRLFPHDTTQDRNL